MGILHKNAKSLNLCLTNHCSYAIIQLGNEKEIKRYEKGNPQILPQGTQKCVQIHHRLRHLPQEPAQEPQGTDEAGSDLRDDVRFRCSGFLASGTGRIK